MCFVFVNVLVLFWLCLGCFVFFWFVLLLLLLCSVLLLFGLLGFEMFVLEKVEVLFDVLSDELVGLRVLLFGVFVLDGEVVLFFCLEVLVLLIGLFDFLRVVCVLCVLILVIVWFCFVFVCVMSFEINVVIRG